MPASPVTIVRRSLNGVNQLTKWLVIIPFARTPVAATKSSCGRDDLCAVRAEIETYFDAATQAVKSISCVAKSLITPTSAIRAGNGPCRRVAIW